MDKADKKVQFHSWYVVAAVLGILFIQNLYLERTKLTPMPYSRFQTLLNGT
jgi:cell division protease FtsH